MKEEESERGPPRGVLTILSTHFFSNLLHTTVPNTSPQWRRSLIVAYNGIARTRLGTAP